MSNLPPEPLKPEPESGTPVSDRIETGGPALAIEWLASERDRLNKIVLEYMEGKLAAEKQRDEARKDAKTGWASYDAVTVELDAANKRADSQFDQATKTAVYAQSLEKLRDELKQDLSDARKRIGELESSLRVTRGQRDSQIEIKLSVFEDRAEIRKERDALKAENTQIRAEHEQCKWDRNQARNELAALHKLVSGDSKLIFTLKAENEQLRNVHAQCRKDLVDQFEWSKSLSAELEQCRRELERIRPAHRDDIIAELGACKRDRDVAQSNSETGHAELAKRIEQLTEKSALCERLALAIRKKLPEYGAWESMCPFCGLQVGSGPLRHRAGCIVLESDTILQRAEGNKPEGSPE